MPLALLRPSLHDAVARWPPSQWLAALFLGLACSLLGYWFWNIALRQLPASTVAAFVFLNPPLAVLFEWLWMGRVPSWGLLVGGALVLAGVRLCLSPPRETRRMPPPGTGAGPGVRRGPAEPVQVGAAT